jgi:hypothetical protein
MLVASFPKLVFWPLVDHAVALLDTLRVALSVSVPDLLATGSVDD